MYQVTLAFLTAQKLKTNIPKSNAIEPYFLQFLGEEVVRDRFNTAHNNSRFQTGVLLFRKTSFLQREMPFKFNTSR